MQKNGLLPKCCSCPERTTNHSTSRDPSGARVLRSASAKEISLLIFPHPSSPYLPTAPPPYYQNAWQCCCSWASQVGVPHGLVGAGLPGPSWASPALGLLLGAGGRLPWALQRLPKAHCVLTESRRQSVHLVSPRWAPLPWPGGDPRAPELEGAPGVWVQCRPSRPAPATAVHPRYSAPAGTPTPPPCRHCLRLQAARLPRDQYQPLLPAVHRGGGGCGKGEGRVEGGAAARVSRHHGERAASKCLQCLETLAPRLCMENRCLLPLPAPAAIPARTWRWPILAAAHCGAPAEHWPLPSPPSPTQVPTC